MMGRNDRGGCPACDGLMRDGSAIVGEDSEDGIGLWRIETFDDGTCMLTYEDGDLAVASLEISHCPLCGRRL